MKAKVRAIYKRDASWWGTVEGVDKDAILSDLKTRAAGAAGVALMSSLQAINGLSRPTMETLIFGETGTLVFPVEVQWSDADEYERVELTLTKDEMTSEIMFGMLTGVLK